MLEPEVESRPWAEQLALDDASYRTQLAYLFERSAFYREKLTPGSSRRGGGRSRRHRAAAAHRQERAQGDRHAREPDRHAPLRGAGRDRPHLLDERHDRPPSYCPLTAGDLDNWVTGSARSYAASGVAAGQRIVSTYNAGPFVAGAALAAFDRIGLTPHSRRHRQHRAPDAGDPAPRPEAVVLTPSYAAHLVGASGFDLRGSSVERVLVAGEPGGGEPAFRAKLEEGWGAKVTEAMGIGDIGVSLWGECEEQDGMHLGARGFVHAELIDPETGAALELERRRRWRARAHAPAATGRRRCSASARATTSRCARARAPAAAPAHASAASAAPTTC